MAKKPEFAMPIPLRSDFDAPLVRAAARRSKDWAQARRLLALAVINEGEGRTEAARIGGVTLQIVRDWMLKCNQPVELSITHKWSRSRFALAHRG